MTNDPTNPEYNSKVSDAIMDLCPFYDPNHKCGIVREHVFKDCLTELRERERLALESARRLDALSSAGMAKILRLEAKLTAALDALDKIESHFVDGDDTYDAWKAMGEIAATFLAENAQVVAPPTLDSNSK